MAGATTNNATPCWVWRAAAAKEYRHPAEVPIEDSEAAKAMFIDTLKGPAASRISPASMLKEGARGDKVLIAEKGVMLEVPKWQVLPWYEGLLLLDEMEQVKGKAGTIEAAWFDDELKQLLTKERSKFPTGRLNGALYLEKRLTKTAITGLQYVDGNGKVWPHRRENMQPEEKPVPEGEDGSGFFKVKDVNGYVPPWEAFADSRCGFYQDFYQVKWDYPFSEIDYSSVENGSKTSTGLTWEPDECLPSHMDAFRVRARQVWIKARREKDAQSLNQSLKRKSTESPTAANGASPNVAVKKEPADTAPLPPAKLARTRRDGKALEVDLVNSKAGHDFTPDKIDQSSGQIRNGWPKKAEDYPKGFAVASPPGFCEAKCDCMDDQRPQRSWETRKAWLEEIDAGRHAAANAAMQTFSSQVSFVRRRGLVSKMFYFESHEGKHHDQTFPKAAQELGALLEKAVGMVLESGISIASLEESDPVRVPARNFLGEDQDYEPLYYEGHLAKGGDALPSWVQVDPNDGRIILVSKPPASELPLQIVIKFHHAEGLITEAPCTLIAETRSGAHAPWVLATAPLVQRYTDVQRCTLERGVRFGLLDHFQEVFDFQVKQAKQLSLGAWLQGVARIARLLRVAAGARLALGASVAKADGTVR